MAFDVTPQDLKKSQKCPPGMHIAAITECEEPYYSEKNILTQKVWFETQKGYTIATWFNASVQANQIEFMEAADKVKFDMDSFKGTSFDPKNYIGKPVCISVSHQKSQKDGKIYAQIDNFFSADKVPF